MAVPLPRTWLKRATWAGAGLLALTGLAQWVGAGLLSRTWVGGIDLHVYLAAARAGLHLGWSHVYDADQQRPLILPYFNHASGIARGYWSPFVTPPPAAWLVVPLTALPFVAAWTVWSSLCLAALSASAYLMARNRSWAVAFSFLVLFAMANTALGVIAGNLVCFLLLAWVGAWWMAERGHLVWAGLLLGCFFLKPQLALMVAPALLVSRNWRLFAAFAGTMLVGLIASLISLGTYGVQQWVNLLRVVSGFHGEQQLSLMHLIHPSWLAALVVAALGALSLIAAAVRREEGRTWPLVAGMLGSLIVSPYLNGEDFMLMAAAAIITAQYGRHRLERLAACALAVTALVVAPGQMSAAELGMGVLLLTRVLLNPDMFKILVRPLAGEIVLDQSAASVKVS